MEIKLFSVAKLAATYHPTNLPKTIVFNTEAEASEFIRRYEGFYTNELSFCLVHDDKIFVLDQAPMGTSNLDLFRFAQTSRS